MTIAELHHFIEIGKNEDIKKAKLAWEPVRTHIYVMGGFAKDYPSITDFMPFSWEAKKEKQVLISDEEFERKIKEMDKQYYGEYTR